MGGGDLWRWRGHCSIHHGGQGRGEGGRGEARCPLVLSRTQDTVGGHGRTEGGTQGRTEDRTGSALSSAVGGWWEGKWALVMSRIHGPWSLSLHFICLSLNVTSRGGPPPLAGDPGEGKWTVRFVPPCQAQLYWCWAQREVVDGDRPAWIGLNRRI